MNHSMWRLNKSKLAAWVVVAFVALLLGGAFNSHSDAICPPESEVLPPMKVGKVVRAERVDDTVTRELVTHLTGGSNAQIVAEGQVVWRVEPVPGPLSSSSKQAILDRYRQAELTLRAELAKRSAKVDTAEDLLVEAGLIRKIAQLDALYRALAADEYVIVRRDVEVPRGLRDVDVISNHYSVHSGEPVDVVFLLEHSRYPGIAEAKRRVLEIDEFRKLDAVMRFNEKTYQERQHLFEAHLEAKSRLGAEPPPEIVSQGRLAVAIWHQEQGHSAAILPSYFIVEPGSLLASVAQER